ncbi:uncharacterized protein LOC106753488 [Vigna radiata var. radiata]|uniref:Uncharacterized protein LOC106753488 n=1 Tax=Vigna radiata var. radiata TaxID=3916 RepID=A0A1S3TAJ5_VIGRR|nr:uncharacterized protein LOC106753488 [Vigna radiata var. radiata]
MAGENNGRRTMVDHTTVVGPHHYNSIARPRVNAANMEVKPALIQLMKSNQFNGLSYESPYEHLTTFNEIYNTVKINGVLDEAIKLILFPFSLGVTVYARVLKSFLEKKRYLDDETIYEQGGSSVLLKKSRPPKVKDPGSFTIPCIIGNVKIGKALIDLGSSINLMPLSVLKKIGGLKVKPTEISLLMEDGSAKKPYGVVEDVVIRVEKLESLIDFVVIEMEEDKEIPIILGRPFMKTAKVREEGRDDKGRMVHYDLENAQFKLGTPMRFKNKLWVVKDFKENGVIEIEAPYSRQVKKVDQKQLMSWCDESKRNTNIGDET